MRAGFTSITWPLIGANEFRTYHQTLTPLVVRVMLIPIAVYAVTLLALLVLRPARVPLWAIVASLARTRSKYAACAVPPSNA